MPKWESDATNAAGDSSAPEPRARRDTPPRLDDGPPRQGEPYLRWARSTAWAGFARLRPAGKDDIRGVPEKIHILGRVDDAEQLAALQRVSAPAADPSSAPVLQLPPLYAAEVARVAAAPAAGAAPWFFTARLSAERLDELLSQAPALEWELGVPLRDPESPARASANGLYGPTRDGEVFQKQPVFSQLDAGGVRAGTVGDARQPVIAVIDFGCPFLHERFRDASGMGTRIAALWDQSELPGRKQGMPAPADEDMPWVVPSAFGYGRELNQRQMNEMCQQLRQPNAAVGEARAYASLNYLIDYENPRRRLHFATHGAHVLDVAGGEVDPLTGKADAASACPLVFVQLPALTAADSSGASLGAYLLDALRYVLHVCHAEAPLVVNISYGSFAGPHDGSTLLEQAMDQLVDGRQAPLAIVLGAGNGRRAGCHAHRRVRPSRTALLRLQLVPEDTTDSFVEAWYRPPAAAARFCLRVRARRFGSGWSPWVDAGGQKRWLDDATGGTLALLSHDRPRRRDGLAMVLLALRPTARPVDDDGALNEPGPWEIEFALGGDPADADGIDIDAWIERDDPGDFSGRPQSSFVGLSSGEDRNTLSSIATGRRTIVVGGFRIADGLPAPYSSVGMRRADQLPLYYAACERDEVDQGITAAAVRSGEFLLMNGTSVAGPVMARRLANALARGDLVGNCPDNAAWQRCIEKLIDGGDPFLKRAQPEPSRSR